MNEIKPISHDLDDAIWHKINFKTKPLGALGTLENLAFQLCRIQNTLEPVLNKPHILVFASDHGIALSGVSAYPQEVSWQMVQNFLAGGAAINVFCKLNGIELSVIDAGINHDFGTHPNLINAKIAYGTLPFHLGAAMSEQQLQSAILAGRVQADRVLRSGCNVVGFGEMGIGNTSSASAIMALLTGYPTDVCCGTGTGIDTVTFEHKIALIEQAIKLHRKENMSGTDALMAVGGFEIAMMCGAMLQAAHHKMVLLIDGFIAGAALLAASKMMPEVLKYAVFSHQSRESGHAIMLEYMGGTPLLRLDMRLGEGTGAALAYPLVQAAAAFMRDMASFEQAGVSNKN